jgi:hypothetical protein
VQWDHFVLEKYAMVLHIQILNLAQAAMAAKIIIAQWVHIVLENYVLVLQKEIPKLVVHASANAQLGFISQENPAMDSPMLTLGLVRNALMVHRMTVDMGFSVRAKVVPVLRPTTRKLVKSVPNVLSVFSNMEHLVTGLDSMILKNVLNVRQLPIVLKLFVPLMRTASVSRAKQDLN